MPTVSVPAPAYTADMEYFADRREAGKLLAERLQAYRGKSVVYALPRGGVETGVEIAGALNVPLDLLIARKIGHPLDPEYAVCAVTETGPLICDEVERARMDWLWLEQTVNAERREAKRRRELYLRDRQPVSAEGKVAIVVDDGIATGLTVLAAVEELRQQRPKKIIVAVPCAPRDAIDELLKAVDRVIVLSDPDEYLGAVGAYYDVFPQLTDEDVVAFLDEADQIS